MLRSIVIENDSSPSFIGVVMSVDLHSAELRVAGIEAGELLAMTDLTLPVTQHFEIVQAALVFMMTGRACQFAAAGGGDARD